MWFMVVAIMMTLGSSHLRGYWQEEEVCPVVNQTLPTYNQTASIKPWYRSAEEK
jgi:hypothetical protein